MSDFERLIEHAFPLKQASLDSVHEKSVRHGHISTLHIWPARRPLAACRAALLATLLPDPGTPEKRAELSQRIGGKVVKKVETQHTDGQVVERERDATEGGVLHWGRETENRESLESFREQIREAHGGRAPKVLDPFAGGGAIPLEAMRLGCDVIAGDINPVAWLLLKATLEYPRDLAGKTQPLPDFILTNREFMEAFREAHPQVKIPVTDAHGQGEQLGWSFLDEEHDCEWPPQADLHWHIRAWGEWVLDHARGELAGFYPTYADFEPLDTRWPKPFERQPMRLVPTGKDGLPDIQALNAELSEGYLADKRNPRWVAKPTVAYLWARTVQCKNCRATIPLLKTRWLCKKSRKRVHLTLRPDQANSALTFGVETEVPDGGSSSWRPIEDSRIDTGTMSASGGKCPHCGTITTMEDIRLEGQADRLSTQMTAVIVEGLGGKEYRAPTTKELQACTEAGQGVTRVFAEIPLGVPDEPLPSKEALGFRVPLYGFSTWSRLFSSRQLLALGILVKHTRLVREAMASLDYPSKWVEAISAYLGLTVDKLADRNSTLSTWDLALEKVRNVFVRFALPITWDFAEISPLSSSSGNYVSCLDWVSRVAEHSSKAANQSTVSVLNQSALSGQISGTIDIVVTDPPYYDAIPYSDLMDYFYVWLHRSLYGVSPDIDTVFREPLSPKWDHETNDGELIDDSSRHGGDKQKSKAAYEEGMFRAFQACHRSLREDGRMVIVFAHKQPDAWETLASAIIRAGFVVNASWPIQTEMSNRTRALSSAALSSSVWLVCKKRPDSSRPGWDGNVLEEMRANINVRLREYWDAGIRGPDFVWAATGPALEAYSKHPVVRKADEPSSTMTVGEFLNHVRRMVVDFVVGRVLSGDDADSDSMTLERLDGPTAYYLLHRHDFGLDDAPAGACILYAVSCGISDRELAGTWDLIAFSRGTGTDGKEEGSSGAYETGHDEGGDPGPVEKSGSKVRLKTWSQRKSRTLGYRPPSGRPAPMIDQAHCLMHLWKTGNLQKVNEYLDENGLRRQELFKRLLQSLIELSQPRSEERSLLESLSNHIQGQGPTKVQTELVV